ncbi:MAG: rRNA maturation RNase YbeY [Acidobacteriaceae bacterium]
MITVDLPERHAALATVRQCVPSLRAFLARAQTAVPLSGHVSVLLASDREIRKLNRQFRGLDRATDVLSFAAEDFFAKSENRVAGDLAVSVDTAMRQAKRWGHPLRTELKILLLHGLLHLAGHDHDIDNGEMTAAEDRLRRRFRLPTALIARTTRSTSAVRV